MWKRVLEVWFGEGAGEKAPRWAYHGPLPEDRMGLWFGKSDETDRALRTEFGSWLDRVRHGELRDWEDHPRSRLAAILLVDQFSRNIHRGTSRAFEYDSVALRLSLEGMSCGHDAAVSPVERVFYYLPLEHSEEIEHQRLSVSRFEPLAHDAPPALKGACVAFHEYAVKHLEIIERFGRFPHRNELVGRSSTPEEIAFLREPGSSF